MDVDEVLEGANLCGKECRCDSEVRYVWECRWECVCVCRGYMYVWGEVQV